MSAIEDARRIVAACEALDAFGPGPIPARKLAAWRQACDEYQDSKAAVVEIARALLTSSQARDEERERLREACMPFVALCDEIEKMSQETGIPPGGWAKACWWEDLVKLRAAVKTERDEKEQAAMPSA